MKINYSKEREAEEGWIEPHKLCEMRLGTVKPVCRVMYFLKFIYFKGKVMFFILRGFEGENQYLWE